MAELSESSVFYRSLRHPPALAKSGAGAWIDHALDLSSGAGVTCLGYNAHRIHNAMIRQLLELPYVHSANFTTQAAEEFAQLLLFRAGGDFIGGRVFFHNSGAEAIEAACKLAHQVHAVTHTPGTSVLHCLMGRKHSYHGASLFTLRLGDHPRKADYWQFMSAGMEPRLSAFAPSYVRPNDLGAYETRCTAITANQSALTVVVEPIGGTAAGIEPATQGYLMKLRKAVNRRKGILIYDEVLCGNFRTGRDMFAYKAIAGLELAQCEPDIICVGKGITGGYFPLSAVMVSKRLMQILEDDPVLRHSSTNQNHPIGCAAGIAALRAYDESMDHDWVRLADHLSLVKNTLCKLPIVEDVVGMGTLFGIRLRVTTSAVISGVNDHATIRRALLAKDIAVYTEGGTPKGSDRMILLAPPYCVTPAELQHGILTIADTLKDFT